MRLTEKGRVGDGHLQAALFDKFVDEHGARNRASGSGGARGASRKKDSNSLEFHPPGDLPSSTLAHPPTMKAMKAPPDNMEQQQQKQSAQAKQRQVKTRARGASGLPPRKYTLEELPHLDQEAFLKALYDDPELARAFAEEHQKDQSKKDASTAKDAGPKMKRSMKQPGRAYSKYRRGGGAKDGSVEKEPQFLDELKKGGVPVAQWAVLIVIAAAVFYQLYKILSGPQAVTTGSTKSKKVPIKKGKANVKAKRQSSGTVVDDPVEEEVLAEVEKAVADPTEKKKKAPVKRSAKKTNSSNAKQKPAAAAKPTPKQELPKPAAAPPKENGSRDMVQETAAVVVDDGEWETVGKRPAAAAVAVTAKVVEPEPEKPKAENGAAAKKNKKKAAEVPKPLEPEPVVAPKEPEPEPVAAPVVEPAVSPKEEVKTPVAADESAKENDTPKQETNASKKKKNKKKAKNQDEVAPQNGATKKKEDPSTTPTPTVTKNDAQLALELQAEEEVLAAAEAAASGPPRDDVWEEVSTRRKKPTTGGGTEAMTA